MTATEPGPEVQAALASCPVCHRPYGTRGVSCWRESLDTWTCLQEEDAARVAALHETALQLALLHVLAGRVKVTDADRRLTIGEEGLPGVDQFEFTGGGVEAVKVRVDDGQVTVRITDQAAFERWVAAHYPSRLLRQPAATTARPLPDPGELLALQAVYDAARAADPWLTPAGSMWQVLQQAGYQLVKIEPTPEQAQVEHEFWQRLEKAIKDNAARFDAGDVPAIDLNGLAVSGVTVTKGKPRVVVLPVKDGRTLDRFVQEHMPTARLMLEAATADPDEVES